METREKLAELGVKPVQGQNFLESDAIIEALVEAGEVEGKDVLEIGAGTGNITRKLADKAEKVYAVEKNTVLANHLKEVFEGSGVKVVEEDILEYEIQGVDRCVSNLPFQYSSEILEKLGENQLQSSLLVQEELADKVVAEPGSSNYCYFTVLINYYFIPVKLRKVSSRNFYPEPEVDAAVLKLYPNRERHGVEDEEYFFKVSKALFTHQRKKVRNAFVDARHILDIEKEKAKQLRDELPNSEERVNKLEIIDLRQIAEFLKKEL